MNAPKKSNLIKFHHIGEALVAKILLKLGKSGLADFLHENPNVIKPSGLPVLNEFISVETDNYIRVERLLSTSNAWKLDGGHKVDVSIFFLNNTCLPIEVKMGTTGLGRSWDSFNKIEKIDQKKKNNEFLKGSVPSFLMKKISRDMNSQIGNMEVESQMEGKKKSTFSSWALIVRKSQLEKFKILPEKISGSMPIIFSFEDLLEYTKLEIKTLINELLTGSVDGLVEEVQKSLVPKVEKVKKTKKVVIKA